MTDHDRRLADVERFLASMQPRPVRVARGHLSDEALTLADRILVAVGGCGALAACLVLVIGLKQVSENVTPSHAVHRYIPADIERLLAQR